jgi:hypothetical protein
MGFLGRKSAAELEEFRLDIFDQTMELAMSLLIAKNCDVNANPVLRVRLAKFVAPATNLQPDQVMTSLAILTG